MPDYNANAECKIWSSVAPKTFQGLCSQSLRAETGNLTEQCEVCITPIYVPYDPPPMCSGTSVWLWVPEVPRWDLWESTCQEGCHPTPPTSPGTSTSSLDPPEYANGGCEFDTPPEPEAP